MGQCGLKPKGKSTDNAFIIVQRQVPHGMLERASTMRWKCEAWL